MIPLRIFHLLLPMKKILLTFILTFISLGAYAQVCNYVNTPTTTGIYPDILPEGMVNNPYDEVITFVLPLDTMDMNYTIVSVVLPLGLNWECNNVAN